MKGLSFHQDKFILLAVVRERADAGVSRACVSGCAVELSLIVSQRYGYHFSLADFTDVPDSFQDVALLVSPILSLMILDFPQKMTKTPLA